MEWSNRYHGNRKRGKTKDCVTWLAFASESDGKLLCLFISQFAGRWFRGTRRIIIILSPSILWISSGGLWDFSKLTGGGGGCGLAGAITLISDSFFLGTSLVDFDFAINDWLVEAVRVVLGLRTATPAFVFAVVSFFGGGLFSCLVGFGGSRSFFSTCN